MQILSIVPECQIIITTKQEGPITSSQDVASFTSTTSDRPILMADQTHSAKVIAISRDGALPTELLQCDRFVTNRKDVALALRFADCVPIVIIDRKRHCLATIHAGWKGLVSGIIPISLLTLQSKFGSQLSDLWIWIGPCIQKESYTMVNVPVQFQLNQWREFISQSSDNYHIDLSGFVMNECKNFGMNEAQIINDSRDTYLEDQIFYSHRRALDTQDVRQDSRFSVISYLT